VSARLRSGRLAAGGQPVQQQRLRRRRAGAVRAAGADRDRRVQPAGAGLGDEVRRQHAGTPDFIALASKVSGHDQTAFLTDWLFGTTTPPMPGHPDWTVDPVQTSAAAAAAKAAAPLVRR
jgi:hypothetical protein